MIVSMSDNKEEIKNILLKVSHLAFEDGTNIDEWQPEINSNTVWAMVSEDDQNIAICKIRIVQNSMIEIHPYAIKEKAKKWKSIVMALLSWIYKNERINKVIALIGVNHDLTYRLSLKIGFKSEGLIKNSYLKNGQLLDQHLIGITRQEIGELI